MIRESPKCKQLVVSTSFKILAAANAHWLLTEHHRFVESEVNSFWLWSCRNVMVEVCACQIINEECDIQS